MSDNKRNVDTDRLAKASQGNAMPSGTGTHATHRVEAEAETKDNKRAGAEGRKAEGKK